MKRHHGGITGPVKSKQTGEQSVPFPAVSGFEPCDFAAIQRRFPRYDVPNQTVELTLHLLHGERVVETAVECFQRRMAFGDLFQCPESLVERRRCISSTFEPLQSFARRLFVFSEKSRHRLDGEPKLSQRCQTCINALGVRDVIAHDRSSALRALGGFQYERYKQDERRALCRLRWSSARFTKAVNAHLWHQIFRRP